MRYLITFGMFVVIVISQAISAKAESQCDSLQTTDSFYSSYWKSTFELEVCENNTEFPWGVIKNVSDAGQTQVSWLPFGKTWEGIEGYGNITGDSRGSVYLFTTVVNTEYRCQGGCYFTWPDCVVLKSTDAGQTWQTLDRYPGNNLNQWDCNTRNLKLQFNEAGMSFNYPLPVFTYGDGTTAPSECSKGGSRQSLDGGRTWATVCN